MAADTDPHETLTRPTPMLRIAVAAYGLSLILHTLDHYRRGTDAVSTQVLVLGSIGAAVSLLIVLLAVIGHRWTALVTAIGALSQAVGVTLVHFGPAMGVYSDQLLGTGADTQTILAAAAEVVAALVAGVIAVALLRRAKLDQR